MMIVPMNTLANTHLEEIGGYLSASRRPSPVTFAGYSGQEDVDAIRTGVPYVTLLNLPPTDPSVAHPPGVRDPVGTGPSGGAG